MGYLIGGRVVNTDTYGKGKKADIVKVPNFKPVQGPPLSRTQDFQARIRSQAADISRTAPTFNDPRYTFTTLSIPTDLRTLNGLYRFFDDTDPIVGNAIRLHTEFPLAGYAFSDCGDPGIKAHYEEMWDRIHGDQLLFDLGLEYWRIGNVFLFGAWNEVDFMWDQFAILNPDYVTVDTTWLSDKPLIKLQPDEALKRIVTTGQPKFLYEQLSPEIIKYVRLGQEIPLDPNNTFFVAHNKAPYEALGKSIIKRLLKMLIYEDRLNMANFAIATRQVIPITIVKLGDPASGWVPENEEINDVKEMFACHDEQTEVLTEDGFKYYKDVIDEDKIGCFDPNTKELKYDFPTERMEYDYDGEMVQFKTGHIDLLVTPNHVMYLKQRYLKDKSWKFQYAEDVKINSQFCSTVEWIGEIPPKFIEAEEIQIPSETFFAFMGWFLSEGSVGNDLQNTKNGKEYRYPKIQITQSVGEKANNLKKMINNLHCKYYKCLDQRKSGKIYDHFNIKGELAQYMLNLFPGGASEKYVPRWMLKANKKHLKILLDTLVAGDGHQVQNKDSVYVDYTTSSKQLADDVYEIAFKLGCTPTMHLCKVSEKHPNWKDSYRVRFSDSGVGKFPYVQKNSSEQEPIMRIPYKGKVWCFTVPTGLFVTRRNGKVSIQKNSREIDPNFTIFYHYGIDVQFYGASGKILNIAPEHDRVRKLKFLGLGISEAMLSGGSATYATAYMNLEVLRQRYLHFQLRMENFIHKGLFEPVAKMCGFYKTNKAVAGKGYKGKVWGDRKAMKYELEKRYAAKTLRDMKDNQEFQEFIKRKAQEAEEFGLVMKPKYVYPKIKWDLLSLTSDVQYRNFLMAFDKMFPGVRKVSDATYYRVLRLEADSEQRQIEIENTERREFQFREAEKDKKFKDKLIAEGLELPAPPPGVKAPPSAPPGGISAPSPAAPTAPGAPKAPVGKGLAEGKPGEVKPGGGPAVLREESIKIQQELGQGLKKELSSEVKQLKKANERMLKERDTES